MPYQRVAPHAQQKVTQRPKSTNVDGGNTLKHKLHDLGKQIQVLVTVFHEIEEQFELGRTISRIDGQHAAIHDPSSGVANAISALRPGPFQGNNAQASEDQQPPQNVYAIANKAIAGSPSWSALPDVKPDDWWLHMSMTSRFASSNMQDAGVEVQDFGSLMDAINDNAVEKVVRHLQLGADPNATWHNVLVRGKEFVCLTPLVASVLQDNAEITDVLLKCKASVESKYSFAAGAQQHECTLSVADACVSRGNLTMLRHLGDLNADLHMLGSNGANSVWQAAYFGHASILGYLLGRGVSIECSAAHQDNSELKYSPLHIAVVEGHELVVSMLLEAQADVRHDDGHGSEPLDDAVRLGHAGIVTKLISKNADLFGLRAAADCITPGSAELTSCLASILHSQNAVLISAMVRGLEKAPKLMDQLGKEDFLRILQAPGSAPIDLMEAIFQPHPLFYWEKIKGELYRRKMLTAYVDIESGVNFMEGPHCNLISQWFKTKKVIDPKVLTFINRLLPSTGSSRTKFVPVCTFMCHVPWVHKDLRVLVALADCPDSNMFSTDGSQAIISWRWVLEKPLARFRMVMTGIEVANFMAINIITDESPPPWLPVGHTVPLQVANCVSLVVWSLSMYMELAQIRGYMSAALGRRYFTSTRHWFDLTVLVMTGAVSLALLDKQIVQDNVFCTLFGVLVFCKWSRFLVYLRQIKVIGIQILPITETMWDMGPFLLVFTLYFLASVNMFYTLDTGHDFFQCFMQVYQLVVLGNAESSVLANTDGPRETVDLITGEVLQSDPPQSGYLVVTRLMLIFVSFVIGLSLMNLFLAMLVLTYSQAHESAPLSFMRSQANLVLDQHAVRIGTIRLFCCQRRQKTPSLVYRRSPSDFCVTQNGADGIKAKASAHMVFDELNGKEAFLWFAKQVEQ